MRRLARSARLQVLRASNSAASVAGFKVIRANLLSEEWFRKIAHFVRMLDRVESIEGDVVECGVGAGKSFAIIASLVRSSGRSRTAWGFSPWTSAGGATARGPFSGATIAEPRLRLRQMAVDDLKGIELIDGEFEETLGRAPERIAFAHIDVVVEEAVRPCLERLWPRLAPGGLVSIGWFTPHSDRPIEEFFASIPEGEARLETDAAWHDRRVIVKAARKDGS